MPLPVSSQTYMPNPLLYAQASQAGLDYGQDIVSGMLDSAQSAANIVGTVQDIGMKPEKMEMERQKIGQDDRRLDQDDKRIGLQERQVSVQEEAEDRLLAQQGLDAGFKQQQLDIQRDRLKRAGVSQGIAAQKRADKELFDGLAGDFILDRNVEGIMGSLGDVSTPSGRRRQAKFLNQLLDDKEIAQGFVNTAEEALANDNLNGQQRKFLEDQVKYLSMHSKVVAQSELAQKGAELLRSQMGLNIEKGEELDYRKDPNSDDYLVRSRKPGSEKWKMVGRYAPSTVQERQAFYSSISSINRVNQIEAENREQVRKAAEAVATKGSTRVNGQGGQVGPGAEATRERPTKENPTAVERRGLQRGAPTPEDEKRAIQETRQQMRQRPLTPAQKEARRRAKKVVGAKPDPDEDTTPTEVPIQGGSGKPMRAM